MNFQDASSLQIPEGYVRTIHDKDNRLLWGSVGYDVSFDGNAEQTTYSGKNLLNINAAPTTAHATRSISGQSITVTTDDQATTARVTLPIEYEANREMTISFDATCLTYEPTATNTVNVYMRTTGQSDPTTPISVDKTVGRTVHYTKTFTPDNDTKDFWFYLKSSPVAGVVSYRFDNVQVEYGASATAYEQFVGGTPAPNPSYPQPISTVTGAQNVKVTGKNLFDKAQASDGWLDSVGGGIVPSTPWKHSDYIPITGGATYTTSGMTSGSGSNPSRCYYDASKNFISGAKHNAHNPFTDTAPANAVYMMESIRTPDIDSVQIELGSTATTYELYQGHGYTIDLGSAELAKVGDYQDYIYKSGDDWYLHKEIGASSPDVNAGQLKDYTNVDYIQLNKPTDYAGHGNFAYHPMLCTHAIVDQQPVGGWDSANGVGKAWVGAVRMAIWIGFENGTTLAAMKAALDGVKFYYALATPTDTKITGTTLIAQLEAVYDWVRRHGYSAQVSGNLPIIINRTALPNV